ncbi:MAG: hypothetical protein CMH55_01730 [Myxococcales bacterium]|nr:hypothetical protein [Myxococcales bacterium]
MILSKDRLFIAWLLLLVLTGGASHPSRLSLLSLPLVLAMPRAWPLLLMGVLLAIPSALELTLYQDWIGPFGARLRLLAGGMVAASAFWLGISLKADRPARKRCLPWIPIACVLLALQALLNVSDVLPPSVRFLNGNHLAALALLLLAPAVGFRLETKARWVAITALLVALGLSTSRWGGVVGLSAALLLLARERLVGRYRQFCIAMSLFLPAFLWLLRSQFNLSKLAIIQALHPITEIRPWSGIGPEGLERQSLRYLMSTGARTTHGESLYLDWASSLGIPVAIALLAFWLLWCLWRLESDGGTTAERMGRCSSLVLLFLLIHELTDFSLTSGAVASMAGFLFAWTLPKGLGRLQKPHRISGLIGAGLTLALPLLAWQFEPLRMEQNGRLEAVDSRWGEHPYRIPWAKARRADNPELRIPLLAKALKQAPGDGLLWLDFGDALYKTKRRTQAREAYRNGFALLQDRTRRRRGKALAQTLEPDEVWQVLRPDPKTKFPNQTPVMVGAATVLVEKGAAGYRAIRTAERSFANDQLSQFYIRSLGRPGLHPDLVIAEALRLLRRSPPLISAGPLLIATLRDHKGNASALASLLALTEALPDAGCRALGQWPLAQIDDLIPHRADLLSRCGRLPSKDLHTENILSRIPRPLP